MSNDQTTNPTKPLTTEQRLAWLEKEVNSISDESKRSAARISAIIASGIAIVILASIVLYMSFSSVNITIGNVRDQAAADSGDYYRQSKEFTCIAIGEIYNSATYACEDPNNPTVVTIPAVPSDPSPPASPTPPADDATLPPIAQTPENIAWMFNCIDRGGSIQRGVGPEEVNCVFVG